MQDNRLVSKEPFKKIFGKYTCGKIITQQAFNFRSVFRGAKRYDMVLTHSYVSLFSTQSVFLELLARL